MRPLTDEEKDWLDQFYKELMSDFRDPVFYTDPDAQRKLYSENNARNRCLYNQVKKTGKLIKIDPKEYDEITLKRIQGLDLEHIIIDNKEIIDEED